MSLLQPPGGPSEESGREPVTPLGSVQHALRVLETVSRHRNGVTEDVIARRAELPADRLDQLLRMLCREGYLTRLEDGSYIVGEALMLLSSGMDRSQALRARLQSTLDELRDTVGAAVYFGRYRDGELESAQVADGPTTPRRSTSGWTSARPRTRPRSASACSASSTTIAGWTTSPVTGPRGSPRGRSPTSGCC